MVPTYLLSRFVRGEVPVVLGGDGGDELFGGYPHYGWLQRQDLYRRLVPLTARRLLSGAAARFLPVGVRGRNHLIGMGGDGRHGIAHVNMFFDYEARRRLLAPLPGAGRRRSPSPEAWKASLCPAGGTSFQQAAEADFRTYLVDDILVKTDRAAMLNSLEVRAPWLDHRIIDLAFGRVPDSLRAAGGRRKILPRLLAQRVLPAGIDLIRKRGLTIPLARWYKGVWGRYMEETLTEPHVEYLDRTMVRELIAAQKRGYSNSQRLFALTMFVLWQKEYRAAL